MGHFFFDFVGNFHWICFTIYKLIHGTEPKINNCYQSIKQSIKQSINQATFNHQIESISISQQQQQQ